MLMHMPMHMHMLMHMTNGSARAIRAEHTRNQPKPRRLTEMSSSEKNGSSKARAAAAH